MNEVGYSFSFSGVYHLTYFVMLFLFSAFQRGVFRSVMLKYHFT